MKNMTELMDKMANAFEKLESNGIGEARAHELSNAAGKMISGFKLQLEYNKLKAEQPTTKTIDFLEN